MKEQELRIGNYVKVDGDSNIYTICSIHEGGSLKVKIPGYEPESSGIRKINPIPLTEQWLIDFGLLKKPNHKCFHIKGMDFHIPIMSGGYYDNEYGLDEENRITLFYVHQLQNLYFALTGEELQL